MLDIYTFRFVRYRYPHLFFVSKTSSKCLQDMPSVRLQDMSSRRLQDMPSRCLEDVFSIKIFRLPRRLARCLQDVFFARRLQDVLEAKILLH